MTSAHGRLISRRTYWWKSSTVSKQDAVGDGRRCPRCRHLASWTKHTPRHWFWPTGSIMTKMTSSTKPEVHYCCTAVRGGPNHGHRYNTYRKFGEIWTCSFRDMPADKQTDRQTNKRTDRQLINRHTEILTGTLIAVVRINYLAT